MREDMTDHEGYVVDHMRLAANIQRRQPTVEDDVLRLCSWVIATGRETLEENGWLPEEVDDAELGGLT